MITREAVLASILFGLTADDYICFIGGSAVSVVTGGDDWKHIVEWLKLANNTSWFPAIDIDGDFDYEAWRLAAESLVRQGFARWAGPDNLSLYADPVRAPKTPVDVRLERNVTQEISGIVLVTVLPGESDEDALLAADVDELVAELIANGEKVQTLDNYESYWEIFPLDEEDDPADGFKDGAS